MNNKNNLTEMKKYIKNNDPNLLKDYLKSINLIQSYYILDEIPVLNLEQLKLYKPDFIQICLMTLKNSEYTKILNLLNILDDDEKLILSFLMPEEYTDAILKNIDLNIFLKNSKYLKSSQIKYIFKYKSYSEIILIIQLMDLNKIINNIKYLNITKFIKILSFFNHDFNKIQIYHLSNKQINFIYLLINRQNYLLNKIEIVPVAFLYLFIYFNKNLFYSIFLKLSDSKKNILIPYLNYSDLFYLSCKLSLKKISNFTNFEYHNCINYQILLKKNINNYKKKIFFNIKEKKYNLIEENIQNKILRLSLIINKINDHNNLELKINNFKDIIFSNIYKLYKEKYEHNS